MIATKFTAARELSSCELPTFQEIFGRRLPASNGYARPISQHVANSKRNYRASPAAGLDLPRRGGIARRQSGCGSTGCAILKKRNAVQGKAVGIFRSEVGSRATNSRLVRSHQLSAVARRSRLHRHQDCSLQHLNALHFNCESTSPPSRG